MDKTSRLTERYQEADKIIKTIFWKQGKEERRKIVQKLEEMVEVIERIGQDRPVRKTREEFYEEEHINEKRKEEIERTIRHLDPGKLWISLNLSGRRVSQRAREIGISQGYMAYLKIGLLNIKFGKKAGYNLAKVVNWALSEGYEITRP